ncbi:MAG TPA: cyclase dehydrase [Azospirillum sp.]|nr:cyclase dehydrase [Azospirillum sp.]
MAYYHRGSPADTLARGLGWFSIGLGLTEVVAGRSLGRWLGMEGYSSLIRAYGVREIGTGIGLLALGDPKPWIWGRVAGDALDLGTLSMGLGRDNSKRENVALAMAAVAGATALDVLCAQMLHAEERSQTALPRDYSDRRGLPRPPEQMRGAARDAPIPADMRTPPMLQPLA